MKKKLILISLLLIIVLFLTGCYETTVRMNFDEKGNMNIKSKILGDTTTSKDDMNLVYWQLKTWNI